MHAHVSTEFKVYCSSGGAREECDVGLAYIANHLDIWCPLLQMALKGSSSQKGMVPLFAALVDSSFCMQGTRVGPF
jgi:hypothetical protein